MYHPTVREVEQAACSVSDEHFLELRIAAACRGIEFFACGLRIRGQDFNQKWDEHCGDGMLLLASVCARTSGAVKLAADLSFDDIALKFIERYSEWTGIYICTCTYMYNRYVCIYTYK